MDTTTLEAIISKRLEAHTAKMELLFENKINAAIKGLRRIDNDILINGDRYYKSKTVLSMLDISESTLYRKRMNNDIAFVVKKKVYYYKVSDIQRFMNNDYVDDVEQKPLVKKPGPKGGLAKFI